MFITFEGPEGSGKTTQIKQLAEFLRERGQDVVCTREPGGTPISDQIRAVITNLENTAMHPRTEILLFQASRAQHVEELIRPASQAGKLVLCDRYADSTLAYQGDGHGYDLDLLRKLIDFATGGLHPDLTLLLDVDVEAGLRRKQRGAEWNRLDAYALEFHRRVRDGYFELARLNPERWVMVDAGRSPDLVQADLRRILSERLAGQ